MLVRFKWSQDLEDVNIIWSLNRTLVWYSDDSGIPCSELRASLYLVYTELFHETILFIFYFTDFSATYNTAFGDFWPENFFATVTKNWTDETTTTTTRVISETSTYTSMESTTASTTTTMSLLDVDQLCGNGSRADALVQDFRFWFSGVAVSAVGSIGLIGNIVSLITIATMMKKSLFNKLLLTLTIFDTLFIFNGGIFMAQQSLEFKNELYNLLFPCVIYPLAGFSMTGKN